MPRVMGGDESCRPVFFRPMSIYLSIYLFIQPSINMCGACARTYTCVYTHAPTRTHRRRVDTARYSHVHSAFCGCEGVEVGRERVGSGAAGVAGARHAETEVSHPLHETPLSPYACTHQRQATPGQSQAAVGARLDLNCDGPERNCDGPKLRNGCTTSPSLSSKATADRCRQHSRATPPSRSMQAAVELSTKTFIDLYSYVHSRVCTREECACVRAFC